MRGMPEQGHLSSGQKDGQDEQEDVTTNEAVINMCIKSKQYYKVHRSYFLLSLSLVETISERASFASSGGETPINDSSRWPRERKRERRKEKEKDV